MRFNHFLIVCVVIALTLTCGTQSSMAQAISDRLPFSGEPDSSWMAVLDQQKMRLLKADLLKSPEELHLSSYASPLDPESFITGIVKYTDGRVVSNPLHQIGKIDISRESSRVAQERLSRLEEIIKVLERRRKDLHDESERLKRSLRHEAGLDEVDKIYDRISHLEDRLGELGVEIGEKAK